MPALEPISSESTEAITVEDFCTLANHFVDQGQYEKAVQLYEAACKLFPGNLALKINLGRVRNLRNQSLDSPKDFVAAHSTSQPAHNGALYANRFQGLGEIFLRIHRLEEAKIIFERSKTSNPQFYLPYLNLGRLYFERQDYTHALEELEAAQRMNPFSEEVCDLLGSTYFEQREYQKSLQCAVDALILSGEISEKDSVGPYRSRIKAIMAKLPGLTASARNEMIRERASRINRLYEELAVDLETAPPGSVVGVEAPPAPSQELDAEIQRKRSYDIAAQLKKHLIFRNMEDEALLKVARFTSEMRIVQGEYVYQERDPVYGLYLISRGKVEIQKATSYGPIIFATFEKGAFFGDDNLLSGRERFTGALAVQETDLLFVDKAGLANIFARERTIAIHFLWYFWKSLSFQIRESNDRMTSFFAGSPDTTKKDILSATLPGGRPTHVEIDKKLEVLHTKGLSTKELSLLARFSNEEIYNEGETIFREGDLGDRLYIVLDGSVLISKSIPGVGEEALAVLKRGDFFGEMALVDQHHRSADAKAKEQGTTVLVVTREALREILSIDTDSAYQFLTILCRILSQRLLEMNEKIYQWRMMSGAFQ